MPKSTNPIGDAEVVYRGFRRPTGGSVIVVEAPGGEQLGVVRHVARHSPTGMSWGYGGSGPADCARSLLLAALGSAAACDMCGGTGRVTYELEADDPDPEVRPYDPSRSLQSYADDGLEVTSCWHEDCDDGYRLPPSVYQAFKFDYVAGWGDEWTMRRSEVLAWLAEHR